MITFIKEKIKSKVESFNTPVKTTSELVQEIHENFYTEVDRLLEAAEKSNSLDTDKQFLIDKCNRLRKLGFTNTKEVKEAEVELERLRKLKEENEYKKNLIEAINYFTVKYPLYKFITEDSVKKICAKYGLVCGEISRYKGTVPDKNLKALEEFKIDERDECWKEITIYSSPYSKDKIDLISKDEVEKKESFLKI